MFKLLLVKGEQEAVVAVLEQECYPNQLGEVVPPIMVEHKGEQFIFKKHWMGPVYVYHPAKVVKLDDLLGA